MMYFNSIERKKKFCHIVTPLILALIFITIVQCCNATTERSEGVIEGKRIKCQVEGDRVTVDSIVNSSCFNCMCKNGFVECLKEQCPNIDGCYTLLEGKSNECCRTCKGCFRDGIEYASGAEWTEPNDPCTVYSCKAGVITESEQLCYTPCSKPSPAPPGQCCPVCHGCYVNGQKVTADRTVTTTEDPCVTCSCNNGRLTCAKKSCPVLQCPAARIIREVGECCPRCNGTGRYFPPPRGACMLGTSIYNSGTTFYVDDDTKCSCIASAITCKRETCPVLECPIELQTKIPGRRCPVCPLVEESRAACTYAGKTYNDGESWKLDSCKACACVQGKVRCAMPMCPPLNIPCPPNSRLEHPEGQCCPRCVESNSVCTVFGDPHYKTFDGKFFSFKGACKYQLVSDCVGHTFSIRVTNDARSTKSSAWTKTIALKMDGLKVNLGQKMRVKVNGTRIDVPYSIPNRLEINRTADSILLSTHIGIKILWDGISFIEVSAPPIYRNRLCGLCGNFNSKPQDDLTSRGRNLLNDPESFGKSWAVGSRKACSRQKKTGGDRERRCRKRKNSNRLCSQLKSEVFAPCEVKVNPDLYIKACLQDMCECPRDHSCYCESFVAYVHECKRLGIQLPHWRNATGCHTGWDMTALTNPPTALRRHHP